jgi:hypothetical protein
MMGSTASSGTQVASSSSSGAMPSPRFSAPRVRGWSGPQAVGGTYADLQLIGAAGDTTDVAHIGFVASSFDFRGRFVIELLGDGNHIGLTLIVAKVAAGSIDGSFGCCGHIGGTFTAERRREE